MAHLQTIATKTAPAPIGPYSQAVWAGNLLFVSGQIAIHPQTGVLIQESLEAETRQVMANIAGILEAAGLDWNNIVKTSIFLSDMIFFATVNEIYGSFFSNEYAPARETVQVAGLPKNVRVEISVIACR
ncbi:MAG: RidA family protein [Chitinophagales bacterium]|nr:RidA family protein [Bacteroidota bacterium]MCB9042223.1 RidA family protein [Chitinophagales bacterium]